jgi:hypothetical protein
LLTVAEPNKPVKTRARKMEVAFLLVAVPMEKRPRTKKAGRMLHRRLQISKLGPSKEDRI